jgi:hypothetical protein
VTSDGNVVRAHRVDVYTSPPPVENERFYVKGNRF